MPLLQGVENQPGPELDALSPMADFCSPRSANDWEEKYYHPLCSAMDPHAKQHVPAGAIAAQRLGVETTAFLLGLRSTLQEATMSGSESRTKIRHSECQNPSAVALLNRCDRPSKLLSKRLCFFP